MQALREAEEANLELSGAQRLSWAAFGWSRALVSTATGTMLSARRSRFFASASRRARPLLRREERRRTTVAFSAQPSNSSRTLSTKLQSLTEAEEANLELSGAQRLSWAAFGWSRALESTATGTMLSARRSRFFASASRRERPLLRRKERRRTTVAFSAQPSNPARTHTFPFGKRVEKLSTKMQALREAEEANLELSGAQRLSWAAFGWSRALESTATGTMLSARRSRFFASDSPERAAATET
ncbi:unnamed protein product [Coccothraustes coccothraustes]